MVNFSFFFLFGYIVASLVVAVLVTAVVVVVVISFAGSFCGCYSVWHYKIASKCLPLASVDAAASTSPSLTIFTLFLPPSLSLPSPKVEAFNELKFEACVLEQQQLL